MQKPRKDDKMLENATSARLINPKPQKGYLNFLAVASRHTNREAKHQIALQRLPVANLKGAKAAIVGGGSRPSYEVLDYGKTG